MATPENPLVSVSIITYQHAAFITECLEGVLAQKTNFEFEILIGEDGSTDGTREICIEYAERFPDKIRLFLHNPDRSHPKNDVAPWMDNWLNNLQQAKGKYIAICEGDDYWTDPDKIQKQACFLEKNKDYSICFHNAKILKNGSLVDNYLKNIVANTTTILDLAKENYIYTASCLIRNYFSDGLPEFFKHSPAGDYPLLMFTAQKGKIKYIDEIMSVYRIHEGGAWSIKSTLEKLEASALVFKILMDNFDGEVKDILKDQHITLLNKMISEYKKTEKKSLITANGINNPYYIRENTSINVIFKALIAKIQLDILKIKK